MNTKRNRWLYFLTEAGATKFMSRMITRFMPGSRVGPSDIQVFICACQFLQNSSGLKQLHRLTFLILGIRNTCAASGCLSFLDASWEKVNNFVIVLIGRKQWDFMLKTTQWKSLWDQWFGYCTYMYIHLVYICMYTNTTCRLNTIGNICYRVICITRGFSMSTFYRGALGKYHLSEATVGGARIANPSNILSL